MEDKMIEFNNEIDELVCRIGKLEKKYRLLKIVFLFLGLLFILFLANVAISEKYLPFQKVISAEQFILVKNGKILAKLTEVYDGPALFFYNNKGEIMMNINLTANMPMISLTNKDGRNLIGMGIIGDDVPTLLIKSPKGKSGISLGLRSDTGDPRIVLHNSKGDIIWEAGAPPIR